MTDTIEPTEEQKQAAYSWCHAKWVGHLEQDLARLLAEHEHKLREQLVREKWQTPEAKERTTQMWLGRLEVLHVENRRLDALCGALRADLDAARTEVEHFRKRLGETDVEACEARTELEAARARIAELEQTGPSELLKTAYRMACEDEGKHLAHIKAGRKAVAAWINDPWIEGRHKMGVQFLSDTAHYDVEGEETK
jgi:hypothetical protein